MSYNLVIVESAAKSKTIEKYLESIPELKHHGAFKVVASFGHVCDLPSKNMGVDTSSWDVTYENIAKKRDTISKLKSAAKEAKMVFLASDPDREGAAIAYHLKNILNLKKGKYVRVAFHEITKKGIRDAFLNPGDIDMAEVHAQESRRILDRVVGYELSPLLWRRFATSSLSAGRVQSAALKIISERSKEVMEHEPETFWTCEATFVPSMGIEINLVAKANYEGKVSQWTSQDDMHTFMERITIARAAPKVWKAEFSQKTVKRNPPPPFITSTLQQEAYQRYNIPAKRTMQLAQNLYEAGHITYMRTDSTQLSEDAKNNIIGFIEKQYGNDAVFAREFASKNEHAQEAHECIRPTGMHVRSEDLDGEWVTPYHKKLYELIWRRAIASQMVPAEYAQVNYDIYTTKWKKEDLMFHGSSKVLVKQGFLELYRPSDDDQDGNETSVPTAQSLSMWKEFLACKDPITVNMCALRAIADVTRPPPLYHEPSLVKVMEKEGIGRPSTYATILDKLKDKGYVTQGTAPLTQTKVQNMEWNVQNKDRIEFTDLTVSYGGKDKDRLLPTSLGERVVEYLNGVTPFLLDVTFTAEMENDLDLICKKSKNKNDVLTSFYSKFHQAVEEAQAVCKEKQSDTRVKKTTNTDLQPSKVLASFANANIVQTKYGPALYETSQKRFVSLTPFMEWKSKSVNDITDKDAQFLLSMPRSIPGTSRTVAYGPYGLYVKDITEGNLPLMDKTLWDAIYENTITATDIDNIKKNDKKYPVKKAYAKKKKASS